MLPNNNGYIDFPRYADNLFIQSMEEQNAMTLTKNDLEAIKEAEELAAEEVEDTEEKSVFSGSDEGEEDIFGEEVDAEDLPDVFSGDDEAEEAELVPDENDDDDEDLDALLDL